MRLLGLWESALTQRGVVVCLEIRRINASVSGYGRRARCKQLVVGGLVRPGGTSEAGIAKGDATTTEVEAICGFHKII